MIPSSYLKNLTVLITSSGTVVANMEIGFYYTYAVLLIININAQFAVNGFFILAIFTLYVF